MAHAHYLDVDEDLKPRVGGAALYLELTDDDVPTDGDTDVDVEEWILSQADDLADGFGARGGYVIPLADGDVALLKPFLLDICNFKLKARRGGVSDADTKLYDDAMALLERVATGEFTLPSGAGASGTISEFGFDSEPILYDRCTLRDF